MRKLELPPRRRNGTVVRVLSLAALIGLVVVVPVLLYRMGGSPFAHWGTAAVRRSLTSNQDFDRTLASHWIIRSVAALAWIAWGWMTVCIALELKAWATGRSSRALPASRTMQAIAACLVGTALAMSSMARTSPARVAAPAGEIGPRQPAAMLGGVVPIIEEWTPSPRVASMTSTATEVVLPVPEPADGVALGGVVEHEDPKPLVHTVQPRETLWSVATARLGSAHRWHEVAELNYGRLQPDGSSLTDEHWIRPGWLLQLPAVDDGRSVRHAGTNGAGHLEPGPTKPVPAVPLGGGIVGAGVIDLVDRLRKVQQRHRADGSLIKLPDLLRLQFERRLRAGEGASVPQAIDGALGLLASTWQDAEWPSVRAVRVVPEAVELVVELPKELSVPPLFQRVAGALRVERSVVDGQARRFRRRTGRGSASVPLLVTAGTVADGVVLVDLESLGSLVVCGDQVACENVVRALALELATSHWSALFDMVLVGFGAEFERFERVTSVFDAPHLALDLCHRRLRGEALRRSAQVPSFAAARWVDDDDPRWAPLVVVCGPSVDGHEVAELLETGPDPAGGTAVVAIGDPEGAAHSVRLTGGQSSNPLELLTSVLSPQQIDAEELAGVTAIIEAAEERSPSTRSEEPYRAVQVPLPGTSSPSDSPAAPDPPAAPDSPTVPFVHAAPTAVRTIDPLRPDTRHGTGTRAPTPLALDDSEDRTASEPEVEVRILGPVEIQGAARDFTRAWAMELVVYLAMHPRGASNEAWATALWPDRVMAPSSLHSTASVARRALGQSSDGVDHLPRSHGRLALEPTVRTDWDRFVALADTGKPEHWRSALELVRGRPFEGLRSSDWPILEGIGPAIEAGVVDLSGRLAGAYLRAGDARNAEWSARQGLLVSPYDERLYRMLLRAADLSGNPAGVEKVMAELVHLVAEEVEPLESVHPSTMQLYRTLTRRKTPRPR